MLWAGVVVVVGVKRVWLSLGVVVVVVVVAQEKEWWEQWREGIESRHQGRSGVGIDDHER